MENIKSFLNKNKQKVVFFGGVAIVMIVILFTISFFAKRIGVKTTYAELEKKLETAAKNYASKNPDILPNIDTKTSVVDGNYLVENNYLKELGKYVKDETCTGHVVIQFENEDYNYQAYLTCKEYKTELFVDRLKGQKPIDLTKDGLYEMNNEYVFRGQNPNNYLQFANHLWRIVKINKDGNIEIIVTNEKEEIHEEWDDRYNTESDSTRGINNFLLSRALEHLNTFYNENYKDFENTLAKRNLCVGKRAEDTASKSGELECNEIIANQYIGLLPLYDFLNASMDGLCQKSMSKECQNYNYLSDNKFKWWTMTGNMKSTYHVYSIRANGGIETDYAISPYEQRYVLSLNKKVLYNSGSGTKEDPYQIR